MLSCKQVAHLASQYLDKEVSTSMEWKIRMHLMMCANCRRFMRHLKITQAVGKSLVPPTEETDAETLWKQVQEKIRQNEPPR